ncbi:MAG TPA: peptidase M23, partial [Bacteroidales bacterium]|nr:peptidase M23 [Bacteroidales bacterium]
IYDQKKITAQSTIEFTISDDLSGIKSYRATLNGEWILMDYDAKKGLLTYDFDHLLRPGANKFELVVMDGCLNTTSYQATVLY